MLSQSNQLNHHQLIHHQKKSGVAGKKTNVVVNGQATVSNNAAVIETWVTLGKKSKSTTTNGSSVPFEKTTESFKNLNLNSVQNNNNNKPTTKKSSKSNNKSNNKSAATDQLKLVQDSETGMLLDNGREIEQEANNKPSTERQALNKRIKKLKSKLKEIETLQRLQTTTKLDESQISKIAKLSQFTKQLNELQAELENIN